MLWGIGCFVLGALFLFQMVRLWTHPVKLYDRPMLGGRWRSSITRDIAMAARRPTLTFPMFMIFMGVGVIFWTIGIVGKGFTILGCISFLLSCTDFIFNWPQRLVPPAYRNGKCLFGIVTGKPFHADRS